MSSHSVADTVDLEADEVLTEVPIGLSREAGASLPTPEEVRMTVNPPRARKECSPKVLWMIAGLMIVVVLIIGVAVGVSNARNSGPAPRRATYEDVIDYLQASGVSTLNALNKTGTAQNAAAVWLAEEDGRNLAVPTVDVDSHDGYHYVSRYVLAMLWHELDGENWAFQTGWLSASDHCFWNDRLPIRLPSGAIGIVPAGSYCDTDTSQLVSLYLDYNNLKGRIPPEIGFLTTLEFLALEGNSLNAGFTRELCELKNLIALTMLDNDLVGLVPECLSGLTKLQLLVLSNNQFSQRLPDLSDMTELRFLYLDDNQFTGDLTTTFNKMSDLRVLYLDDNEFHGVIDEDFMKDHAELRRVDISGNEFNGTFPGHFFENSPELQVLDIHDNRFEGPLPTTISNHSSMLFLAIHNNDFSGAVPDSLTSLTRLFHLDISLNAFSGAMPNFFDRMERLSYLFMGDNPFDVGPIPDTIAHLDRLEELSLKKTGRDGEIPDYLGNLTQLLLLDLDDNDLNGTAPESLGNLERLQFLLLNRNQRLGGVIPQSYSKLTALRQAFFDNTAMTGNMEPICSISSLTEPTGDADGDERVSANCAGPTAQMACVCCDFCCKTGETECHKNTEIANLQPEWEYIFDRYEFGFGSNETFYQDRKYIGAP